MTELNLLVSICNLKIEVQDVGKSKCGILQKNERCRSLTLKYFLYEVHRYVHIIATRDLLQ